MRSVKKYTKILLNIDSKSTNRKGKPMIAIYTKLNCVEKCVHFVSKPCVWSAKIFWLGNISKVTLLYPNVKYTYTILSWGWHIIIIIKYQTIFESESQTLSNKCVCDMFLHKQPQHHIQLSQFFVLCNIKPVLSQYGRTIEQLFHFIYSTMKSLLKLIRYLHAIHIQHIMRIELD